MRIVFCRRTLICGIASIAAGVRLSATEFENRNAFRDQVIAIGRQHFPDMPFAAGEGVVISGDHTLYLDNIRHIVRQLPVSMREDAIVDWLKKFTPAADRTAEAIKTSAETWDGARPLLRPRLMPRGGVHDYPGLIHEPFQSGIEIFYTIDLGDKDLYVRTDRFDPWKVSLPQVHDAAIANLDGLSATMPLEPQTVEGIKGRYLMVHKGDGYDAARILLPAFRKRLLSQLGPIVFIGVPAKDLMICWSGDFAEPEAMVHLVEDNAKRLPHLVSTAIFALTEEGLNRAYLASDDADARRQAETDRAR